MNKFLLLTTALLIPNLANAAESTCSAAPSCSDLGYTQAKTDCEDKYVACPFDTNKVLCINQPNCTASGYTQSVSDCAGDYIKCPSDSSKVLCINAAPKVGDLKYSLNSSNHDGWLRCDGTQYSTSQYPKLYSLIGTKFCHKYTSRTDTAYLTSNCSSGKFAVPDYRGFFLRGINVYNASSNTVGSLSSYYGYALYYKGNYSTRAAFTTPWLPQYEQLPNLTGDIGGLVTYPNHMSSTRSGVFAGTSVPAITKNATENKTGGWWNDASTINFNASRGNTIYNGSHVMPASYGAYIFIYAGDAQ